MDQLRAPWPPRRARRRSRARSDADELRHLLAEERDEDVFLGLEVEIDGAGGDPRLARDVRDPRVVVALAGEDPNGGLDDLLGLVGIAHGRRLNRRSFYAAVPGLSNGNLRREPRDWQLAMILLQPREVLRCRGWRTRAPRRLAYRLPRPGAGRRRRSRPERSGSSMTTTSPSTSGVSVVTRPPDALRSTVWPVGRARRAALDVDRQRTSTRSKRRRMSPRETNERERGRRASRLLEERDPDALLVAAHHVPTISIRPAAPGKRHPHRDDAAHRRLGCPTAPSCPDRLRLTTSPGHHRPVGRLHRGRPRPPLAGLRRRSRRSAIRSCIDPDRFGGRILTCQLRRLATAFDG